MWGLPTFTQVVMPTTILLTQEQIFGFRLSDLLAFLYKLEKSSVNWLQSNQFYDISYCDREQERRIVEGMFEESW